MMRMLDNCTLDTSQVKLLQDDLNYYVDNNQDMDFNENEMMYDDIDLEEVQSTVFTTAGMNHQVAWSGGGVLKVNR